MPISVSNGRLKKNSIRHASLMYLLGSRSVGPLVLDCIMLTVVHLFGTGKVYIHYGTFQFQLNACITKPGVYDMKKVIICFITNVT
jgi:hypothetical protein